MSDAFLSSAETYERQVSFNEKLYLASELLHPGLCIQVVFETSCPVSEDLCPERLRAAIQAATALNPGARLILRGALGWLRWVARGPIPPLRVIKAWAKGQPPPAELERPLCPKRGPTCEVVLTQAPQPVLVFRAFHGVMDARGLMHFAEEVFRALRGEDLVGTNDASSDSEFVLAQVGAKRRPALRDNHAPLVSPQSAEGAGIRWRRYSLSGPVPGLVAKISVALASYEQATRETTTRIMIPVDMRHYAPQVRSTSNLSNPLFIDVHPEEGWRSVHKRIVRGLLKKEAMRLDPNEEIARWIPLVLFKQLYRNRTARQRRSRRYPMSALLTHVALRDASAFAGCTQPFSAYYFMPSPNDALPLCVSAMTVGAHTELVVSAPSFLLGERQLDQLGAAIAEAVSP